MKINKIIMNLISSSDEGLNYTYGYLTHLYMQLLAATKLEHDLQRQEEENAIDCDCSDSD